MQKFFAYLESFSSKLNCAMIEALGAVSSVFYQLAVTELLGSKVRSIYQENLIPLNLEQKTSSYFSVAYTSLIFTKLGTLKN